MLSKKKNRPSVHNLFSSFISRVSEKLSKDKFYAIKKESLSNKYVNDKWQVKHLRGAKIRLKEKSSRGQTVFNSYVNFRLIF